MRRQTGQPLWAVAAIAVCTSGCIDNTISQQPIREIAVVTGDFDHMSEALDRMLLPYTEYEGFICCASYDASVDPEANTLKAELREHAGVAAEAVHAEMHELSQAQRFASALEELINENTFNRNSSRHTYRDVQ